ncbi:hypothetical protein [Wocania ichthyoenteri]|uniref:hypothetical protein n=1 Tax=Wocania ichthyoenteri TaxID=1230531 RepID=UPI00053EBBBA|nr:hypothetical protein [Wocania ichthyoenteri]
MKYLTIFLCFISTTVFSQDLERIKSQEVLIVYFDTAKDLSVEKRESKQKNDIETISYYYYFIDSKYNKESLSLHYWTYLNFDDQSNNIKALKVSVNKSFLRKNKSIILTKKVIDKIGYAETLKLFSKAKKILLIDGDDVKKKLITIKEVRYFPEIII